MTIELTKEDHTQAITSLQQYFRENMDEPIGNLAADPVVALAGAATKQAPRTASIVGQADRIGVQRWNEAEGHDADPVRA